MSILQEKKRLKEIYFDFSGSPASEISLLPKSGSERRYYRISSPSGSLIAVVNNNREENDAFIGFARHFKMKRLRVPEIYLYLPDEFIYFQQDLGNTNLYEYLKESGGQFGEEGVELYKKVLDQLLLFQIDGADGLDFELCYPHRSFDRQSMSWDLNYFKYMFLKLLSVPFSESKLEKEFNTLIDFLLGEPDDFFLYRDFQSANIMIVNNEPWFIDFQGGRRGALQYDVASLLYDAKANIPQQVRELLLDHYIGNLCKKRDCEREQFTHSFACFTLIRLMQALGAFGFRGLYEQRPTFVASIVPATRLVNQLFASDILRLELPELRKIFDSIPKLERFRDLDPPTRLTISIKSFSYRNGVPTDKIHGGGFVFDCRGLVNPGKLEGVMKFDGRSSQVKSIMDDDPAVRDFINDSVRLIKRSVEAYKHKGYTSLSVSFGCTGGKHRSVYCAEKCFEALEAVADIDRVVTHTEIWSE